MFLCLDDGPGRAVVIFDAGTALGAFIRVDDILLFAFTDSTHGTLKEAAATLDAVFGYFIGHNGLLQGWSGKSQQ
jgi:pyoverdine/dityrosine biosynthesis protein Dit1